MTVPGHRHVVENLDHQTAIHEFFQMSSFTALGRKVIDLLGAAIAAAS